MNTARVTEEVRNYGRKGVNVPEGCCLKEP